MLLGNVNDGNSTLVQVIAWSHLATSHYLSQCWARFMLPYGVNWPQWVYLNIAWLVYTPFQIRLRVGLKSCSGTVLYKLLDVIVHDNVITYKCCVYYSTFMTGIHWSSLNFPSQRISKAELWCSSVVSLKKIMEQIVEFAVILDT